jgi:hypothetical protein
MKVTALLVLALAGSAANAAVIYDSSVQTASRFNPGSAGVSTPADNRRTAYDDVNFADASVGANAFVEITKVTVGVRRLANAPATDVTVTWSTFTTPATAPDTELDLPASVVGTTSLAPNGAAAVTQLVSFGDGVSTLFTAPLSNLVAGFKSIAIGLNLSSADSLNGWRLTTGAPNANVFWQHDPFLTGQANPEAVFQFGTTTLAQFYIVVEGQFVPTPGAVALMGLGGLLATRRRRA